MLRKSVTYQKRAVWTNCCLLSAPICFCLLLMIIQMLINKLILSNSDLQVRSFPSGPSCPHPAAPRPHLTQLYILYISICTILLRLNTWRAI